MNTFVNHLQSIVSSRSEKARRGDNQTLFPEEPGAALQEFLPVPCSHTRTGEFPVWQVRLEVLKTTSPADICLEINGDIILGAEDAKEGVINLSDYQDSLVGVSRRHLKISPTGSDLLLIDLNSTNGTHRNGRPVQPGIPCSLYDGDVLELGNLTLAVNIVKAPMDRVILNEENSNVVNALIHISTVITSNLHPDEVLDRILETAVNLCRADEIALLLWELDTHELYLRAERGIGDNKTRLMKIPVRQDDPVRAVLQTGRPLRSKITNGQKSKIVTGYLVEAALYVPVSIGRDSIGVLVAMHREKGREFSPEDERMLSTIGKFSAISIQNSQKYEATNAALQRKVQELSGYTSILEALAKTNSLTAIFGVLREHIRQRWDIDNIGLWLVEPGTRKLLPFPKPTFHRSYSFGEELIGMVASRAEPTVAADIKLFSEPTTSFEPTLQLLARSAACVPILENDTVIGILGAFSKKENEFTEEDLPLLQTVSLATATALRNVQLFEQVDKQRATMLAAVNMLPHPVMIVDHNEKIVVSNKAADALLNEIHSSANAGQTSPSSCLLPIIKLMNGLSESKWCTREITVEEKVYVATLEYASMVGTVILMQDVTDPVTGIFNQRHFRDLAEQAFRQAKRYVKPLAALVIGFGELEQIIGEKGYALGNEVLKEMASRLRGILRAPDILGRHQDDKFIVFLPETSLENARVVAQRILDQSKSVSMATHRVFPRLMVGMSMLDIEKDDAVDAFIERAYRAYISAKGDKGCQIQVYEEVGDCQPDSA